MTIETICGYKVRISYPSDYDESVSYPAVILNDGEMLEKIELQQKSYFFFGIESDHRLDDYTPWKEPAIRAKAPDFGGMCDQYHQTLLDEIIPDLVNRYHIKEDAIGYGGYSLGGLAAIYSLFKLDKFSCIFSICGSFWYPHFCEYVDKTDIVNKTAKIFLLNGSAEGSNHNNILEKAPEKAEYIHNFINSHFEGTVTGFDDFGHHEAVNERFQLVNQWLEQYLV